MPELNISKDVSSAIGLGNITEMAQQESISADAQESEIDQTQSLDTEALRKAIAEEEAKDQMDEAPVYAGKPVLRNNCYGEYIADWMNYAGLSTNGHPEEIDAIIANGDYLLIQNQLIPQFHQNARLENMSHLQREAYDAIDQTLLQAQQKAKETKYDMLCNPEKLTKEQKQVLSKGCFPFSIYPKMKKEDVQHIADQLFEIHKVAGLLPEKGNLTDDQYKEVIRMAKATIYERCQKMNDNGLQGYLRVTENQLKKKGGREELIKSVAEECGNRQNLYTRCYQNVEERAKQSAQNVATAMAASGESEQQKESETVVQKTETPQVSEVKQPDIAIPVAPPAEGMTLPEKKTAELAEAQKSDAPKENPEKPAEDEKIKDEPQSSNETVAEKPEFADETVAVYEPAPGESVKEKVMDPEANRSQNQTASSKQTEDEKPAENGETATSEEKQDQATEKNDVTGDKSEAVKDAISEEKEQTAETVDDQPVEFIIPPSEKKLDDEAQVQKEEQKTSEKESVNPAKPDSDEKKDVENKAEEKPEMTEKTEFQKVPDETPVQESSVKEPSVPPMYAKEKSGTETVTTETASTMPSYTATGEKISDNKIVESHTTTIQKWENVQKNFNDFADNEIKNWCDAETEADGMFHARDEYENPSIDWNKVMVSQLENAGFSNVTFEKGIEYYDAERQSKTKFDVFRFEDDGVPYEMKSYSPVRREDSISRIDSLSSMVNDRVANHGQESQETAKLVRYENGMGMPKPQQANPAVSAIEQKNQSIAEKQESLQQKTVAQPAQAVQREPSVPPMVEKSHGMKMGM